MRASAHRTKWRYLEQVSAADDRLTRLSKRSIQPFIRRRMSSFIRPLLEYTDSCPLLFWHAATAGRHNKHIRRRAGGSPELGWHRWTGCERFERASQGAGVNIALSFTQQA